MKKKLIAIFAACTMITTAFAGMTAYAAGPDGQNVRIEVSDGATDEQKVLTFYYEGAELMNAIQGTLSFEGGEVTINSINVTIANDATQNDTGTGIFFFTSNDGTSSADGSFATVNITVPTDADITANFELEVWEDVNFDDYTSDIGTVSVVIPKKAAPEPEVEVTKTVENSAAFTVAEGYDNDMVVGKVTVTIKGSYDLKDATYNQNKGTVTDAEGNAVDSTVITGGSEGTDVLVFVVINGVDDVAELDNVVFE
jgi:hypothetical protein